MKRKVYNFVLHVTVDMSEDNQRVVDALTSDISATIRTSLKSVQSKEYQVKCSTVIPSSTSLHIS